MIKYAIFIALAAVCCTARGDDAIVAHSARPTKAVPIPVDTPPQPAQSQDSPSVIGGVLSRISVNTASPLDMNWTASMDLNTDTEAPQPAQSTIILPFLEKYPIENLEIKLKLLDLQF